MSKIETKFISCKTPDFQKELDREVKNLASKNFEVEVQYQPVVSPTNGVIHYAVLIGRRA